MVIDKAGGAVLDSDSSFCEVSTQLCCQPVGNSVAYKGPIGPACVEKFDKDSRVRIMLRLEPDGNAQIRTNARAGDFKRKLRASAQW
jgi:hypothetical protein